MGYMESYREWLENPYFDEETKAELKAIQNDEKEIREYKVEELKFRSRGCSRKEKMKLSKEEQKMMKELE